MKLMLTISCLIVLCQAVSHYDLGEEEWDLFKTQYKKEYQNETEEKFRMKIFMNNKMLILRHNKNYEMGLVSYKMAVNEFADLLRHEFLSQRTGFKRPPSSAIGRRVSGSTFIPPDNVVIPKAIDWRKKGAVTPVKNQRNCLSCWAFSATGALEGQNFRKTGKLISLSEQNLVDCSLDYGNDGCQGGWPFNAFQYVQENDGIDTEKSYPYEGKDAKCRYNPKNKGATETGYMNISAGNEEDLKAAVATAGPVSVAIDADHDGFQFYAEGVYYDPECSSEELSHAVLAVGYGVSEKGEDYWIVKNSWGKRWGKRGYILMSRNKDNNCGIASVASYPLE